MNVLDKAGLTKLWKKIKAKFATKGELDFYVGGLWAESLEIAHNNTGVDIMLNNANGSPNTSTEIEAATESKAGVMIPEDKVKVNRLDFSTKRTDGIISNESGATISSFIKIMDLESEYGLYYIRLTGCNPTFTYGVYGLQNSDTPKFIFPAVENVSGTWDTATTVVLPLPDKSHGSPDEMYIDTV